MSWSKAWAFKLRKGRPVALELSVGVECCNRIPWFIWHVLLFVATVALVENMLIIIGDGCDNNRVELVRFMTKYLHMTNSRKWQRHSPINNSITHLVRCIVNTGRVKIVAWIVKIGSHNVGYNGIRSIRKYPSRFQSLSDLLILWFVSSSHSVWQQVASRRQKHK